MLRLHFSDLTRMCRMLPRYLLIALLTLLVSACQDKVAGPRTGPPPTSWRLVLRAPSVMYRDHPGGRVSNDTITVRVFDGAGNIQNGIVITSHALKSPQQVSPQVNSVADTITKPWGTDQPLLYYGSGDSDPTQPEIISSQAILHSDTVARAEARFLVHDPIQLMLFGADTLYRSHVNGFVPYDTIRVRLFNNTGGMLGGVPINCRCQLSPDSVTPLVTSFADTISRPWGSDNPVCYFGGGDRGDPGHQEIVTCWAAVNGDTTTAQKAFYVWNH